MLSPAFGAATAIWLMLAPVLGLQTGIRAPIALAIGVVAFVLSSVGLWSRAARGTLALLGLGLAFLDLALPADIGAQADLATCAAALITAGLASWPVVAYRSVVVAEAATTTTTTAPRMLADDVDTAPQRPLSMAA